MKRSVLLLVVLGILGGCGGAPVGRDSGLTTNLADRLQAPAGNEAAPGTSGSLERHRKVTRGGITLDAVTLVAPLSVRADLGGYAGEFDLTFRAAPVFNFGDGMQLSMVLADGNRRETLLTRYFDAGRNAQDRKWAEVRIPLRLSGRAGVSLEIQVSAGPQGDLVTDWLALAGLRLEQK